MGNSQTQMKKQNKKSVTVSHPVFETAQLIRNTMGKEVMEIKVSVRSQKEYQQWVKSYKRIPRTQSMLFPQQTTFSNKGCCGSSGIAQIQYPLYPYVLSEQIINRRLNNNSHFQQQQIWLLLFSLLQAAEMFHVRKLKIGDIKPQNIFMNSVGEVKVLTQLTYPYAVTNYTHTVTNHEYNTYLGINFLLYDLAPQQIKDIQFGKIKDTNDPIVVQSFSIGLTVLDAALLTSSEKLYQNMRLFGYQQLDQNLRLLQKVNYSSQLTAIITKMCDPQVSNILKANQVLKYLKPFSSQILNKKPFNLSSLPWGKQQKKNINNNSNNKIIGNNTNNNNGQNKNITINTNQNYPQQNQQNTTKPQDYKFIPGVVFDSRDEGLLQSSSLKNGKQVVIRNSRVANTYEIPQKSQLITDLHCPVQTSIYYPPITIQLPPPIQHNVNANRSP